MFKWQLKKYQVPDMIVQNCSTQVAKGTMKEYDIMVWAASVIQYKNLGYKVKLYCATEDIPNLKKYHLYELYDEIDTKVYDNCARELKGVNLKQFWSAKKLIALKDAFKHRKNVIYSDTDIIMFDRIYTTASFIFWCIEPSNLYDYPGWESVSTPKYFWYPKYLFNSVGAYNCGIMKMNKYNIFKKYYKYYFKFVKNNPCILPKCVKERASNFYACFAEQRLIKAILDYKKENVLSVSNWDNAGIEEVGIHLFMLKHIWVGEQANNNGYLKKDSPASESFIKIKDMCLEYIEEFCKRTNNKVLIDYIRSLSIIKNKELSYR